MNLAKIHEQFKIGITNGEVITELTFEGFLGHARTRKRHDVARQKELQSIFFTNFSKRRKKIGIYHWL